MALTYPAQIHTRFSWMDKVVLSVCTSTSGPLMRSELCGYSAKTKWDRDHDIVSRPGEMSSLLQK